MGSRLLLTCLLLSPYALHASFIESTMGTAVVNDATATYNNPAALTLNKKPQFIALGSYARFAGDFAGRDLTHLNGKSPLSHSKSEGDYYVPSVYVGVPVHDKVNVGFAVISNILNSNIDETSILRYFKPNSRIDNVDFISGFGVNINPYLSIGAGLLYSNARFTSNPITGFPNLNLPDSQSLNQTRGNAYGENAGFLIKPSKSTVIGFNYRSALSYQFNGQSHFNGTPAITSNNYHFNYWTPARGVVTLSHFITHSTGFISTVQRVQWGIFKNVVAEEVATQVDNQSIVLPKVVIPYHFHDSWIFTLGGIQYFTPQWVVRLAGTYNQSPGNGHYQITNGDTVIIGASMGYEIYKNIILDGSYAHTFIKNQTININSRKNMITGVNTGFGDAISIKLTINMDSPNGRIHKAA